jgi:hypothetical protein
MNERIAELYDQALILGNGENRMDELDPDKFAELIVQKCLYIMENCDGDLDFAIWKTKKDFGVKE